jgi:hypothetical protein
MKSIAQKKGPKDGLDETRKMLRKVLNKDKLSTERGPISRTVTLDKNSTLSSIFASYVSENVNLKPAIENKKPTGGTKSVKIIFFRVGRKNISTPTQLLARYRRRRLVPADPCLVAKANWEDRQLWARCPNTILWKEGEQWFRLDFDNDIDQGNCVSGYDVDWTNPFVKIYSEFWLAGVRPEKVKKKKKSFLAPVGPANSQEFPGLIFI